MFQPFAYIRERKDLCEKIHATKSSSMDFITEPEPY